MGVTELTPGFIRNPDGGEEASLKQAEFNTISSSGEASLYHTAAFRLFVPRRRIRRVNLMSHSSHLARSTSYFDAFSGFTLDNLPQNGRPAGLAHGLAEVHTAYGSADWDFGLEWSLNCVKRADTLCDQSNERNAFDQRHLEYELLGRCVTPRWFLECLCTQSFASHSLHVARRTFGELAESAEVDAKDLGNQTFRYEPNRWDLRRLL